ncbi:MAG: hypothetical protein SGJ20_17280 [Planctomycetota bacterium]|nr:hypothetical protein [Planctomycetota bacterium]
MLALFAVLCVVAALFLGISIGDLHAVRTAPELLDSATVEQMTHRATVHRLAGLSAALVVILVNSIAVTYFIGTSRWCKEVVETYSLDRSLLQRSQQLKRSTFPWAISSMLGVVGLVALGGAADPGTGMPNTADWVMPHFLAGFLVLGFVCLAFWMIAEKIRAHHQVITEIVAVVRQIRLERGLEV